MEFALITSYNSGFQTLAPYQYAALDIILVKPKNQN
jgi:hypothetical protein